MTPSFPQDSLKQSQWTHVLWRGTSSCWDNLAVIAEMRQRGQHLRICDSAQQTSTPDIWWKQMKWRWLQVRLEWSKTISSTDMSWSYQIKLVTCLDRWCLLAELQFFFSCTGQQPTKGSAGSRDCIDNFLTFCSSETELKMMPPNTQQKQTSPLQSQTDNSLLFLSSFTRPPQGFTVKEAVLVKFSI